MKVKEEMPKYIIIIKLFDNKSNKACKKCKK